MAVGLPTEEVVNLQVSVEVTNQAGMVKITLPDGQTTTWPVNLPNLSPGKYYLILSHQP